MFSQRIYMFCMITSQRMIHIHNAGSEKRDVTPQLYIYMLCLCRFSAVCNRTAAANPLHLHPGTPYMHYI